MFGPWCLFFVVCCVMFVVCCLCDVGGFVLHCSLYCCRVVLCLVRVARRVSLVGVTCCMVFDVWCVLFIGYCLVFSVSFMLFGVMCLVFRWFVFVACRFFIYNVCVWFGVCSCLFNFVWWLRCCFVFGVRSLLRFVGRLALVVCYLLVRGLVIVFSYSELLCLVFGAFCLRCFAIVFLVSFVETLGFVLVFRV